MAREYLGGNRDLSSIRIRGRSDTPSTTGSYNGFGKVLKAHRVASEDPTEFTKAGPSSTSQHESELLDEVWPDTCKLCNRNYYSSEMKHDVGLCAACLERVAKRVKALKYQQGRS